VQRSITSASVHSGGDAGRGGSLKGAAGAGTGTAMEREIGAGDGGWAATVTAGGGMGSTGDGVREDGKCKRSSGCQPSSDAACALLIKLELKGEG
jgi:hypothetical protein